MYRLLFQLVLLPVFNCRKEAWDKRKQFRLDRKSLSTSRNKVFPKKNGPFISVTAFTCKKRKIK